MGPLVEPRTSRSINNNSSSRHWPQTQTCPHRKSRRAYALSSMMSRQPAGRCGDFPGAATAKRSRTFSIPDNPDAYKSKFQLALGDASEKAKRFLHFIEVDSTPADVICSDNKRYTIIGGIDVFSRKCKFLVSPTSNSWAISALIRNIIIDWGLPENVIRDNGQDYASHMVNQALHALEINVIAVQPFTPEGKPRIERTFRSLSHGLFEKGLPGYIGHGVADRQAIENGKGCAERMGKDGRRSPAYLPSEGLTWQDLRQR